MDLFEENNDLGAIINYSNYFKEKKPIWSLESNYDSKHINNLAPDKQIPDSLIETINKGITLEQLDEISHLPICHYKTQITIHGICPTLKSNKVYGYSALVINNNKSLGVRWLAIDRPKKNRIADYLGCYDWATFEDSQVYCYSKNFYFTNETKKDVYTDLVERISKIDRSLFFGYIDILEYTYSRNSWIITNSKDHYEVVIYLQGIYEKNIQKFLMTICNDSWENIEAKLEEFKQRIEQRLKEKEQEEKEREESVKKAQEEYEQWCKDNPFPDKFQKIDFDNLQAGDVIGYYEQYSGDHKHYYELYLNYKRLCYRSCDENGVSLRKSGHVLERRVLPDEFWVWRRNADRTTEQSARPTRGTEVEILDYRTNEVVVLGYTKNKYWELKNLGGGKWDKYISIDGRPMAQGWRFPRSKRTELEKIFGIENPSAEPQTEPEKPQETPKQKPKYKVGDHLQIRPENGGGDFVVSKIDYYHDGEPTYYGSDEIGYGYEADETMILGLYDSEEVNRYYRFKAAQRKAQELYNYAMRNTTESMSEIMNALNGAETEQERKIAQFIMEIGTRNLNEEESDFYNAFIETDSMQTIQITDLLGLFNILKIVANNPEYGSRHILVKHFGVKKDYVTADEIVKMGEIIRAVEPQFAKNRQKHPNRRVYEKNQNGVLFKVVIDVKDKKGVLVSFYSDRAEKK